MKRKIIGLTLLTLTIVGVIAQAVVTSDGLIAQVWATLKTTALTVNSSMVVGTTGNITPITAILSTNVSVDFGSCNTNVTVTSTVTLTGATTNDVVVANFGAPHTSFRYLAAITAADTITLSASNISITNAIDQAAMPVRLTVIKY